VEVIRALQFHVQRALNSPNPAALARIGTEAQVATPEVDEVARGLEGVTRLVQHVNRLDVDLARDTRVLGERYRKGVADLQQAVETAAVPRTINELTRTTATLTVAADALRLPEPARRLADRAANIAQTLEGAQNLVQRTQNLATTGGQLTNKVQGYLGESRALLATAGALAQTFNIPTGTITRAQRTIQTAQAAIGVVSSLASGNVFGAVGAVSGLLGGGGPDQGELRHRELMNEFEKVHQSLDEVKRGQQQLLDDVAALDRKIDQLAAQSARNHAEVMSSLGDVNRNVLWVGRLTVAADIGDLNTCKDVAKFYEQDSYRGRRDFAQNHAGSVALCNSALARLSVDPMQGQSLARVLWLDAYDTAGVEAQRYSRAVVKPLRDYFLGTWLPQVAGTNTQVQRRLMGALAAPSFTVPELSAKLYRTRSQAPEREIAATVLTNPVQDSAVVEFARRVLDLHGVLAFFTPTGAIRPEVSFFNPAALPLGAQELPGEFQLKRALEVVDYATAQQTLLNGDIMLPQLSEMLLEPQLIPFTEGNLPLAFNVMRYAVYEVAENPRSAIQQGVYEAALTSTNPAVMSALMTRVRTVNGVQQSIPLPVRRDVATGEYQMQVGQKWLRMPDVEEFRNRELMASPPLQRLIGVREALLDVIAGYEMLRIMTPQERARYYRVALIR
jgi:uncharacterized protein YoxC